MSVMDISGLDAEFAPTRRQAPHLILTVNEDDEEILLPLEGRFMNLPALQVMPDLAAPFRDPNPPLQEQGILLMKRLQPFEELPPEWKVYSGLDYLGVDEHLRRKWNAQNKKQKQKEDTDDEVMDNKASQHGLVDVNLSTKRRVPMNDVRQLLQQIDPGSPHIATIGLLDSAMPDATSPKFGPSLEPRPQQ